MRSPMLMLTLLTASAAFALGAGTTSVTIDCPTVSSGSASDALGFVVTVGEPAIGGAANGQFRMHLGFLGCVGFDTMSQVCPWDLDGGGAVNITDFLALLQAWGSDPGGPPDFDSDGDVGITDFLDLLAHWGACP